MKVIDVGLGSGVQWLVAAVRLLGDQPVKWAGLISLWFLTSAGMFFLLPPVGSLVSLICQPALFGGLMIAARDQENGMTVQMGHLWAGFRAAGRALIGIGALVMLAEIGSFMMLIALGFPGVIPQDANQEPDFAAFAEMLKGKEALIFFGFAISVLIKGVFWFATPLIALKPMPPGHALRWCFYALVANFFPMLVFAALVSVLFLAAMLPSGLGLLLFFPVYALAHYTSFRAIFRLDDPGETGAEADSEAGKE